MIRGVINYECNEFRDGLFLQWKYNYKKDAQHLSYQANILPDKNAHVVSNAKYKRN